VAGKVAVLGWYGHGNLGDEAMLDGLHNLFDGWNLQVFSDNSIHPSTYPSINFEAVNKCDMFVLGGGELICPDRLFIHNRFHKLLRYSPWTGKVKVPKAILGCGVNAHSPDMLAGWVIRELEKFDYIGVRDFTSLEILQSFPKLKEKVHYFPDLAFSSSFKAQSCKREDFAVVVPTDRHSTGDKGVFCRDVAEKSRRWLHRNLKQYKYSVFLAFGKQDNDDYVTCEKLSQRCKGATVQANNLDVVADYMARCSAVYPYRLHGLIFAFMAGTKCFPYMYHWKVARMQQALKNISLEDVQRLQREEFAQMLKVTGV
jgi:polysaccharide pyruvyl transferase WcaK-like protein